MKFKLGDIVEYKDEGGSDAGLVVHINGERVEIFWFEYSKSYPYYIGSPATKKFNVISR